MFEELDLKVDAPAPRSVSEVPKTWGNCGYTHLDCPTGDRYNAALLAARSEGLPALVPAYSVDADSGAFSQCLLRQPGLKPPPTQEITEFKGSLLRHRIRPC